MDQRSKRHGIKSRTVALKAEEEFPKVAISKKGKGKALITKTDSESSSSDDDSSEIESLPEIDADEEMMKLCALMVKAVQRQTAASRSTSPSRRLHHGYFGGAPTMRPIKPPSILAQAPNLNVSLGQGTTLGYGDGGVFGTHGGHFGLGAGGGGHLGLGADGGGHLGLGAGGVGK
ncbi:hypothetical protein AgCh_005796 [Apium graveolens]